MIGMFKGLDVKKVAGLVSIFLGFLSLSIFLTVNLSWILYALAIRYFDLSMISGKSGASLMKCYFFIVRYLEVPWDMALHLVFFRASARGLRHFRDVKMLIMINNGCMLLFNYLSFRFIDRLRNMHCVWKLIDPLRMILTTLMVLMSLALVDFQQFFINLHRILFRNQDWVFNEVTDPVIKVLPMPYFGWCFLVFILTLLALFSFLIYRLVALDKRYCE